MDVQIFKNNETITLRTNYSHLACPDLKTGGYCLNLNILKNVGDQHVTVITPADVYSVRPLMQHVFKKGDTLKIKFI